MQQYNILRILKGQNPKSASIKLLQERMLDKMSNSSRLVDKLVDKKLVDRIVCPNDRRRVEVSINQNGLLLLELATNELDSLFNQKLTNFTLAESAQLSDLLDKFRS
jgi:DNA-binding MarR family transcriptional regulator